MEAIRGSRSSATSAGLATAWTKLAFTSSSCPCRYDRAERAARRAAEHARRSGEDLLLANALSLPDHRAVLPVPRPRSRGVVTLEELVDDIARQPQRSRRARSPSAARSTACKGRSSGSATDRARYRDRGGDREPAPGRGHTSSALGEAEIEAGDPIAAERAYRRSYEVFREIGWERGKARRLRRHWPGRSARSAVSPKPRDTPRSRVTRPPRTISSHRYSGDRRKRRCSPRAVCSLEAERLGREAIEMFADAECPNTQGHIRMDLARVLMMAGMPTDAEQTAAEAAHVLRAERQQTLVRHDPSIHRGAGRLRLDASTRQSMTWAFACGR